MHQLCRQDFGDRDQVFDPVDVRTEGIINRWSELDASGAIDDDTNLARQPLQVSRLDSAMGPANVARPNRDLLVEEIFPSLFSDRGQRRGLECFAVKPFLGGNIPPWPNEDVEVLEVRKAIEEQPQDDLAQETVPPGQKDFTLMKSFTDVCQHQLSRHLQPGKGGA